MLSREEVPLREGCRHGGCVIEGDVVEGGVRVEKGRRHVLGLEGEK